MEDINDIGRAGINIKVRNNFLPICFAALLSGVSGLAFPAPGDLTLSAPVLGSNLVIHTSAAYAGAVSSIIFRGTEYIDAHDHGRLLQSASSFDGYGECFNPTEGGSKEDYQKDKTTSVLKAALIEKQSIMTSVDMAFWLAPGDDYPRGCGSRKEIKRAVNTTFTSGHVLDTRISIGFRGLPNVINYQVTYHVPESFTSATFEASTAYVPRKLSRFYYFNPRTGITEDAANRQGEAARQGEQAMPVILATPDEQSAIGVYSPYLPQNGMGYGLFSFKNIGGPVNKWNCVFREHDVKPGNYSYQCLIPIGTLKEVEDAIVKLDKIYHPNLY